MVVFQHVLILKLSVIFTLQNSACEIISNETIFGLTSIINNLSTTAITIFLSNRSGIENMDEFLCGIHRLPKMITIFYDSESYLKSVDKNLQGSIETTTLILMQYEDIMEELLIKNLGHRLNLFILYSGYKYLPKDREFREPFRVLVITRPKPNLYKIFYNQKNPKDNGKFEVVNFFNCSGMGHLNQSPLFPESIEIYRNFEGRILHIPVIHSPPWYFVNFNVSYDLYENNSIEIDIEMQTEFEVTGGREDTLLKLLAEKLNFSFVYTIPPERTQGSLYGTVDNISFSGGLGMLQRREADLFLGDIAISRERTAAVEFSFFTLADSEAFATHSVQNLNEALALIRPFRWNVWPILIVTFICAGPLLYLIIILHIKLEASRNCFHPVYLKELGYGRRRMQIVNREEQGLFPKCIWFTTSVFLRQSSILPNNNNRVRFVTILLWLAGTYVIGDLYSAQLTSQLAKPAREQPINTLYRLKAAMFQKGYQLYVERQSSSLSLLENGTGIFHDLYIKMKSQRYGNHSYLISSVEEGISLILNNFNVAILGGRETLYFNMKRYGLKNFQLSEKLYTRYSAVAVQAGCPYLESLNDVIMRLYEANILEKITNQEYEQMIAFERSNDALQNAKPMPVAATLHNQQASTVLQPINLKMLQGAFFALILGYISSALVLVYEIFANKRKRTRQRHNRVLIKRLQTNKTSFKNQFQEMCYKMKQLIGRK